MLKDFDDLHSNIDIDELKRQEREELLKNIIIPPKKRGPLLDYISNHMIISKSNFLY